MKFDERNLALLGLANTLEKLKDYTTLALLCKHEGFGSKLDEILLKLEGTKEKEEILRKLEEADNDSLEYESDLDNNKQIPKEEKKKSVIQIEKVQLPKRVSVPNQARKSIKVPYKPQDLPL